MSLALTENISAKLQHQQSSTFLKRDASLQKIIEILSREHSAYPILIGPTGSGRTTCLYQLAEALTKDMHNSELQNLQIRRLDLDDFELRAQEHFADHLQRVLSAAEHPSQPSILFLDEIESLLQRKPEVWPHCLLAIMQVTEKHRCKIGFICNTEIYYEKFAVVTKLHTKLTPVFLESYNKTELIQLLENNIKKSDTKRLVFEQAFLSQLIDIANKHIKSEGLPASALNLIDKLLAQIKNQQTDHMSLQEILSSVLAGWYGIHLNSCASDDPKKITALADSLQENIFGQHHALQQLQQTLLAKTLHLTQDNDTCLPLLFIGEKSIGKRSTALTLNHFMHGLQATALTLDASLITSSQLSKLMTEHLQQHSPTSFIFLNTERTSVEVLTFIEQIILKNSIQSHSRRTYSLANCLLIFICQQTENLAFNHIESASVNEQQDELLQLVVNDLPGMQPNLLGKPSLEFELTRIQPILQTLPESLIKQLYIIPFQRLSFSAREKLVEKYLQQLSKRITLKYAILLVFSIHFIKNLLLKLDLSQAFASDIQRKLDEALLPLLSHNLLNIPAYAKNLHLEFSLAGDIISRFE